MVSTEGVSEKKRIFKIEKRSIMKLVRRCVMMCGYTRMAEGDTHYLCSLVWHPAPRAGPICC